MYYSDRSDVELDDIVYSVYYNTQDQKWETGKCYWCGSEDGFRTPKKVILVEVFNAEKMTEVSVNSPKAKQLAKTLRGMLNDDPFECLKCLEGEHFESTE